MRRNEDMEEYKDISRGLKMLLDKNIISEEVFPFIFICLFVIREFVIQRTTYSDSGIVSLTSHCVDIREQGVSELDGIAHLVKITEFPHASLNTVFFCGMTSKNG